MPPRNSSRPRHKANSVETRSSLACERCRSRKTRCLGQPPDACAFCQRRGLTCVYPEEGRKYVVSERTMVDPSTATFPSFAPYKPMMTPLIVDERQANNAESSEGDTASLHKGWWFAGTRPIVVEDEGQQRFSSPKTAAQISDRLAMASVLSSSRTRRVNNTGLPQRSTSHVAKVPTSEYARQLYTVFYANLHSIFCFLDPECFQSKLDYVYAANLDLSPRDTALDLCQVLIVCAFGELYSGHSNPSLNNPPGFEYFDEALKHIPAAFEGGSVQFVEVLCGIGFYLQTLNRHDTAFLYIGIALRMAVSLGLQVEIPYMTMSNPNRRHAQRVWWSVYGLDRIMSVKSGNPTTIRDTDINASFPESSDVASSDIALRYRTELARLLGNIGEDIYRKWCEASSSLLTSITRTFNELSAFAQSLPDSLHAVPQSLDLDNDHEAFVITLLFHGAVMMAARPLVFYVVQRRLKTDTTAPAGPILKGLSPSILGIIMSTVASARATALLLGSALSQSRLAAFSYLEGEQAFAASLILIMASAAFPEEQADISSTETALSVLRSMGERGNEYARDRHSLLLKLRQNVCPQFAGQDANGEAQPPFNGSTSAPTRTESTADPSIEGLAGVTTYQMPLDFDLVEADLLHGAQNNDFDLDVSDDPGLWDEMLHGISVNMDVDWIDAALRTSGMDGSGVPV